MPLSNGLTIGIGAKNEGSPTRRLVEGRAEGRGQRAEDRGEPEDSPNYFQRKFAKNIFDFLIEFRSGLNATNAPLSHGGPLGSILPFVKPLVIGAARQEFSICR